MPALPFDPKFAVKIQANPEEDSLGLGVGASKDSFKLTSSMDRSPRQSVAGLDIHVVRRTRHHI